MPQTTHTPVLIVGAGPVGLALAGDLGWRGIACTLIEKTEGRIEHPKMDLIGVRTMEFCRHLGIAEAVTDWGFPPDFCMDNVFVAGGLNGWELSRVPLPPMGGERDCADSPERQRHCPQTWFDPILRDKAASYPHITLKYQTRFESAQQDDELAARYAARAAERIEHVADYLGSVEPRALIRDAEQLARTKPALFFGGAFLVGLAAGRFLRASSSNVSNGGPAGEDEWQSRSSPSPEGASEVSSSSASPKRKSSRRRPGSQESSGAQRTTEGGLGASSIEEPLR